MQRMEEAEEERVCGFGDVENPQMSDAQLACSHPAGPAADADECCCQPFHPHHYLFATLLCPLQEAEIDEDEEQNIVLDWDQVCLCVLWQFAVNSPRG